MNKTGKFPALPGHPKTKQNMEMKYCYIGWEGSQEERLSVRLRILGQPEPQLSDREGREKAEVRSFYVMLKAVGIH